MSITEYIEYAKEVLKESLEALMSSIPIILNYLILFIIVCGILGTILFFIIFRKNIKRLFKKNWFKNGRIKKIQYQT